MEEKYESEVSKFLQMEESQLQEKLGAAYNGDEKLTDILMGPKDTFREFGKKVFAKIGEEAYKLVCGNDSENKGQRQKILDALATGKDTTLAAVITGALVVNLGWSVLIAGLVASLAVKLFIDPAYSVFCQMWKEKLAEK